MTDTLTDTEKRAAEWAAWVKRIFGTPEAYAESLPHSIWVQGEGGWVSYPRD